VSVEPSNVAAPAKPETAAMSSSPAAAAPAEPAPGVPAPRPAAAATLAVFPDAGSWRDWVAGCDLRGPARLLAEHAGFIDCADGVLRLSLEPDDEHLKGAAMLKMLGDALAPRFGAAPQIRFETPAKPVDSVRVHLDRARGAKQAAAERDFEQHPDVRHLVAQGGRIIPESVRPLEG
jgi:DNA polymerase-3 subunit gamma/tau